MKIGDQIRDRLRQCLKGFDSNIPVLMPSRWLLNGDNRFNRLYFDSHRVYNSVTSLQRIARRFFLLYLLRMNFFFFFELFPYVTF